MYRGKLILYGCGDLVNDYEGIGAHGSLRCDVGCLYVATLDARGALERLDIAPLQSRRFRLQDADGEARAWLERVFNEAGREFGTRVEPQPDGTGRLCWPVAAAPPS